MTEAPYASAREVMLGLLDLLRPRARETVSQYALRRRQLHNPGGGYSGPWTHDLAPALVEPMDCLSAPEFQSVCFVGPGQSAKTTMAENWLLQKVGCAPADTLWYLPTDELLEAYVKTRINPLIEQHDELRGRLGKRPGDDSLHFKRFAGMHLELLAASAANLINKKAPHVVVDEVDACSPTFGDVRALLDVRVQTYGRAAKVFGFSHPDRGRGLDPEGWTDGIMAWYADSDRRVWYWCCPDCGSWSSPVPIADKVMTIFWPAEGTLDQIAAEARLVCPWHGCLIEDRFRRDMLRYGRWIGLGQQISQDGIVTGERARRKTAGFWAVGAMSLFVNGGIGALARARVKAEREAEISGETKSLRQVMAKQWGHPWCPSRSEGSVDANELAARAEAGLALGAVPQGVRFLVGVADVQAAHFEWLVLGIGEKDFWVVDRGRLAGAVDTSPEDWDQLHDQVFNRAWPLADGSGRAMRLRGAGYDSGGVAGVTEQAYTAFTRWKRQRKISLYGTVSGRDAWSLLPLKGAESLDAQRLLVTYPDTQRKANVKAGRGGVPLARFNANLFKDTVAGMLKVAESGEGCLHFPSELRSKEKPHVWFEQLTAEERDKNGRWHKKSDHLRNEALDLVVMARVIAHLQGLGRLAWDKAPPWAQEWDKNTLVIAPEQSVQRPVPGRGAPAVAMPSATTSAASSGRRSPAERMAALNK